MTYYIFDLVPEIILVVLYFLDTLLGVKRLLKLELVLKVAILLDIQFNLKLILLDFLHLLINEHRSVFHDPFDRVVLLVVITLLYDLVKKRQLKYFGVVHILVVRNEVWVL